MAKRGRRLTFHGAYKRKRDARRKEAEVPDAFILSRRVRGSRRYIVATEDPVKFLVNPSKGRANMARTKRPKYPAGHPKAGQFMSNRAIAARKAARSRKRKKSTTRKRKRRTRRNPGRTVSKRKTRRRRTTRRNPPRRKVDIMGTLIDSSVEATQILVGKAAARSIPDLVGLPKQGNVGIAVQAGVALASGWLASMFLSEGAARAITAGGLTAPIESLVIAYKVPWLSTALHPVTAANGVSAYVGRGAMPGGVGGYVRRRPPNIADRGLGAYVSSEERGIPPGYGD